jgi:hypothetical protein
LLGKAARGPGGSGRSLSARKMWGRSFHPLYRTVPNDRSRSPSFEGSGRWSNVDKGSRQIRCVTSGKALAPRTGTPRPSYRRKPEATGLLRTRPRAGVCGRLLPPTARGISSVWVNSQLGTVTAAGNPTVKLKQSFLMGQRGWWQKVISAQCSYCQSKEI